MSEIEEIARDLVALWQSPVIQGLARADRNAAIEDTRNALIKACSSTVEPSAHNAPVVGSNPAGPTNVPVAKQVNAEDLNSFHFAGSSPARDTITQEVIDAGARALCLAQFGDVATHGDARCCQVGGKDGCCLDAIRPEALACITAALCTLTPPDGGRAT